MKDIPDGYQYRNSQGYVEWTAIKDARPAEAPGWWRVEVVFDNGKPGNKFFKGGNTEVETWRARTST